MQIEPKLWDVIIVGGGPAGINAATVLARMRRRVLLIDAGEQRNLRSHGLHNYPTRDGILPPDFLKLAHEELDEYKVPVLKTRIVKAHQETQYHFTLTDVGEQTYECRRLLIATGVTDTIPDVEGMEELWGCAVHHCPYCDGWECRDLTIGLYAKNVNGYGMALALCQLTEKVVLFTDGNYYIRPLQRARLKSCGVEVVSGKLKRLLHENGDLKAVELENGSEIPCDKMFVNNGLKVNDLLLKQLGCRTTIKGAAVVNRKQQTRVPGVYVAGDAAIDTHFVVVAAAEGAKAAIAIHDDLLRKDHALELVIKDL